MTDIILEAQRITKTFGGLTAVAEVDLAVARGEIFALIGPNGAGKTTTFNIVSGAYALDKGKVIFEGHSISGLPANRIAARGLVRTFQNLQIFGTMSVLENVMVGRHLRGRVGFITAGLRLPGVAAEERQTRERALEFLEIVGLEKRAADPANSLSFGQQRLVEIARALASEPKLLMLDEPAAGLTRPEVGALDALIMRIHDSGITVLLVEHDMNLVMGIADRVAVLNYGRKIAEGAPAAVQSDERVIGAYLGVDWDGEAKAEHQPPTAAFSGSLSAVSEEGR